MYFRISSKKHFQKFVFLLITAFFVCTGLFAGIGVASEILQINSLKDLTDLRDAVNNGNAYKDYIVKLNVDIDLSGEANWQPIGDDHDEHIFKGTFDGQGHTISNLKIHDDEGRWYYAKYWDHGLFGATDGATIKNLVLKNVDAFTEGYTSDTISIGSLIGWMKGGSVINCSVSGLVSAEDTVEYVGGLIGRIEGNGKIENCSVSVIDKVHGEGAGDSGVGGLIGWMDDGSVINCSVSGLVSTGGSVVSVGGLIGNIEGCEGSSCSVVNCSFSGSVFGEDGVERIGGLIGRLQGNGKVIDCSVNLEGDIKSEGTNGEYSYLGGLIGFCDGDDESSCSISNCFVIGKDKSMFGTDYTDYVGGLIGWMKSGSSVYNSFVLLGDGGVIGGNYAIGGLIGGMEGGSVNNCFVSGYVNATGVVDDIGGLIGFVGEDSSISNCYTMKATYRSADVEEGRYLHLGGLIGSVEEDSNVSHCVALNDHVWNYGKPQYHDYSSRVIDEKDDDAQVSMNYAWDGMSGGSNKWKDWQRGIDTSSQSVWKNLTFWQNVFGPDMISYDGTKLWTIDKLSPKETVSWGLPYLTHLGKPTDDQAKNIQYLNPYQIHLEINSIDDLKLFRYLVNSMNCENIMVTLNTSIDLKNEWWDPIFKFRGVFEGNGYTISNMTNNVGLFHYSDGAVITNLTLENVSVLGYAGEAGGLVGLTWGRDTIQNCVVTGNVSSASSTWFYNGVGGLIGQDNGGVNINNCSAYCTVSSCWPYVGGLIGTSAYGHISNSSAYCTVSGPSEVGGLIGNFYNGNVDTCFAYGAVSSAGGSSVGGLIGNGDGVNVNNCSAYGEIYGVKDVGGLIGSTRISDSGNVCNCFASGFIVGIWNGIGGLVGNTGDELNILNSLALNHYINGSSNIERISGGSLQMIENTFAWDNMTINGNLVHEGGNNGTNVSSSAIWANLIFWQSVFGADNISDDGSKMWNIIKPEDDSLWGLPYLTRLGKPSDKYAEKIQYLKPHFPCLTNIAYNDGQYAHKQALSQNKLPRITLYKDIFDITQSEGINQSFSLNTSTPWQNSYLWMNNSHPITFSEVITDNVSWNSLESIAAMKNQNITVALGDEHQTSISGSERNVSITVENYLQSYMNNSMDKTKTTEGWFFDTPYTVSLVVRPGPEAYHASEQNGKLWNSYVMIQNLTNNVGKQDSVSWRFATDAKNTIYNNYTAENQNYLNSSEYLQVKSAESADGENVNITLTGYKLGDVNRNDVVNINDISAMIKLILAAAKDNNTYEAALKAFPNTRIEHLIYADDNKKGGDGLIDVSDLLVINDWLVNGSVNFNYDRWICAA